MYLFNHIDPPKQAINVFPEAFQSVHSHHHAANTKKLITLHTLFLKPDVDNTAP